MTTTAEYISRIIAEIEALKQENADLRSMCAAKDKALRSIYEYWNGHEGSAVDAAEQARSVAGEVLDAKTLRGAE
jgi:hypothetical protein